MLKRIPLPFAGVMLGLAALGNLLQSYSEVIRLLCGGLAAVIGLLLIVKAVVYPSILKEDLKNPITASVAGTFSMALMLLAGYAKPFIGNTAAIIWYLAIALHVALIIYFTAAFMRKLDMARVFASYYIVYVGIAVASITAPAFAQLTIGTLCFWFGFVTFIALFFLITYRYLKYQKIPEPARPLFCIYTAPLSLCLAGYIQSVTPKAKGFLIGMALVATLLYLIVLCQLPQLLKLPFYPSYAAFTFPFVISAIAIKQTMVCLAKMGAPVPWLSWVVLIETVLAAVLVCYALLRFVMAIVKSQKTVF